MHLNFLHEVLSISQATNSAGEGGRRCLLHLGERGSMVVLFCKKVTAVVGNTPFHKGKE